MAKLTLADLASLANQVTAINTINANSALIETALENTLSRDGTSPNTMGADLDMNSNRVINLPDPISAQEAATKSYVDDAINTATGVDIDNLSAIATTTPYDSDPDVGYFAEYEGLSAHRFELRQEEEQDKDEDGGIRSGVHVFHYDNDTFDYEAVDPYRTISDGIRVGMFGKRVAGNYVEQVKDFHGITSMAIANVGGTDRGVAAYAGDSIQFGSGVCLNEFNVYNPAGSTQSGHMAGLLTVLSGKVAAADASHRVLGIEVINIGKKATAAFQVWSSGTDGDNGRFGILLDGSNATIDTAAIVMPDSASSFEGKMIVYDTGDYSYYEVGGNAFVWTIAGTNRFQIDAGNIYPSTNGGMSIGTTGLRFDDAFFNGRIDINTNITTAASGFGGGLYVDLDYTYTGGAPGTVNSPFHITTAVSADVADFVWGGLSRLFNSATAGENVAFYGQAHKLSTGDTWAGVFEADDTTETANPTGALYGIEVDIVANGTDDNNARRGLEIIGWRSNVAGADTEVAYGLRIGPSNADVDNMVFKKGISLTNGSGATTSAYYVGVDLSESTSVIAALQIGTDQAVAFDSGATPSYLIRYNSVLGGLEQTMAAASANSVLYSTISRRTSGTAAAGIGTGLNFLTESDTGVDRIGGYIAMAMSSVTNAAEEGTFEFGLMSAGTAASKLQLTATSLRPMVADAMSLGTAAKPWSDADFALGAVVRFNNADTLTHSAGALAFSGNFSAANVTSGTYTPTVTGVANTSAQTAFATRYIRIGNVVYVSGLVQIDPVAAASTLTQVRMTLPIASELVSNNELTGVCAASDALEAGGIYADTANNAAMIEFVSATTSNHNVRFNFSYSIL